MLVVVLVAGVAPDGHPTGTVDVALVQGGGPQRTRAADTDERDVVERHLAASEDIETPVDLVVWPENVINVEGPVEDQREGQELSALARELDAPLVVGVVEGDGDGFHNAALVVDAEGEFTDRFEKVRRVPFGEYVPFRSLLSRFAGDALPARDAIEGEGPATVETDVGTMGVVISWEVFFANRARDAISNGGEILLNPTNGSSYWLTIVQTQQVASSRLRAMETGRWVLQAAPTGLTAIITPDGEVLDRTAVSERAVVQGTVETREGLTIYTRVGDWPMVLLAFGLVIGSWVGFRRRSSGRGTDTDGTTGAWGRAADVGGVRALRLPTSADDGTAADDHRRHRHAPSLPSVSVSVRSDLEQDRGGAVVDELDLHVGAEAAGGHRRPQVPQGGHDQVHQGLGVIGGRGLDPGGAAALVGVAVEGELADDQHLAGGVGHRTVHHPVVIGHDPQAPDLVGQLARLGLGVVPVHTDQHAETGPDLADRLVADPHPGPRHPLHQTPHGTHPGPKTARSGHT